MEDVLQKQKEFQNLLHNDVNSQAFIDYCIKEMIGETVEAMRETPHKQHKQNQTFNKEKFVKELSDVQIYLINLLIAAGYSWEDFEKIVREKVEINFARQKNGY